MGKVLDFSLMEFVSGNFKLRDIFLDNGHWWKLFLKHRNLIRLSIITNVLKLLVCRTHWLGYHCFSCPQCGHSIKVPHSCKSRFCPPCGKKATDDWIKTSFNTLPDTTWQHITFTMPGELWELFWINRQFMNQIPPLAANIILKLAKQKGFLPGIFLAIHTFGRDLKRNFHIHLSTTVGGLSTDKERWRPSAYFYHDTLKKMWRYEVISFFREEFKAGRLKLPPRLKHLKSYQAFNSWLNVHYQKTWVVHLAEQSDDMTRNVEYLGKYLKRPPLGETRIKAYNKTSVSFEFLDHYTNEKAIMTLPVLDFIARLIAHIPDANFRNIRYYGFLANRVRGTLLPKVRQLLCLEKIRGKKVYTPWRTMIQASFNFDPLCCPICKTIMELSHVVFPVQAVLAAHHKEIALEHSPLLR